MFSRIGVVRNLAIFTPVLESHFNKLAGLEGCFPVNIAKFLRAGFYIEQLRWLLLKKKKKVCLLTGFVFISSA